MPGGLTQPQKPFRSRKPDPLDPLPCLAPLLWLAAGTASQHYSLGTPWWGGRAAILSFLGFGHFRKQVQHSGETGHLHPQVTPWGAA